MVRIRRGMRSRRIAPGGGGSSGDNRRKRRGGCRPMPHIENRPLLLWCKDCGHEFVDSVPHAYTGTGEFREDTGTWLPIKGGTRNVKCPKCNSKFVERHPIQPEHLK